MSKPIVVAFITTDLRDDHRRYSEPMPSFGTAPTALLQGFANMPGCEVHVIACVQQPVASPVKLEDNIYYHSVTVGKWGWMRGVYAGCAMGVRRKLAEIKPDAVHGQGTERYCALSAAFSGFPNVITLHGNMRLVAAVNKAPVFSFQWLAGRLEAFVIPRSGGVVCITNYTHEAVLPLARRTWVVPNAVDKTFFEVERSQSKETTILCIGAVCFRKNQNAFIRAMDPLVKSTPFKLLFAGGVSKGEPYSEEFLALVKERSWCEYVGFGDRQSMKKLLSTATMLALPTQEDNCPMVVLEAAAAGVPVIASNVGGVPDLVDHDKTGILFDPKNDEEMRAAVQQILGNPDFAARLAVTAKQQAQERFHPQTIARRHLEIYGEMLAAR